MKRTYPVYIGGVDAIIKLGLGVSGSYKFLLTVVQNVPSAMVNIEYKSNTGKNWKTVNRNGGEFSLAADGYAEFEIEDGVIEEIKISGQSLSSDLDATLSLDVSPVPTGIFGGNRAVTIQSYDSANIKRGLQFELPLLIDPIAGETSKFILVEVGSKDIILKTREIDVNGGMEYRPWKNVSTYTKGALIDEVVNLNGKSSTVNTVKFYEVSGVDLTAPAKSFDIVKSTNDFGNNRGLGKFPEGVERIIPAGSTIILEFKNTQTQVIWTVFKTTWYEGQTDVDPEEML